MKENGRRVSVSCQLSIQQHFNQLLGTLCLLPVGYGGGVAAINRELFLGSEYHYYLNFNNSTNSPPNSMVLFMSLYTIGS